MSSSETPPDRPTILPDHDFDLSDKLIYEFLCDHFRQIGSKIGSNLESAIDHKKLQSVLRQLSKNRELLEWVATIDYGGGQNLLAAATSAKSFELARLALQVPECLNMRDVMGYTPLMNAINFRQYEIALKIAQHPETMVYTANNGYNALHMLALGRVTSKSLQADYVEPLIRELMIWINPHAPLILSVNELDRTPQGDSSGYIKKRHYKTPEEIARAHGYDFLAGMIHRLAAETNYTPPETERSRWRAQFVNFLNTYELSDKAERVRLHDYIIEGDKRRFFDEDFLNECRAIAQKGRGEDSSRRPKVMHVALDEFNELAKRRGWSTEKER